MSENEESLGTLTVEANAPRDTIDTAITRRKAQYSPGFRVFLNIVQDTEGGKMQQETLVVALIARVICATAKCASVKRNELNSCGPPRALTWGLIVVTEELAVVKPIRLGLGLHEGIRTVADILLLLGSVSRGSVSRPVLPLWSGVVLGWRTGDSARGRARSWMRYLARRDAARTPNLLASSSWGADRYTGGVGQGCARQRSREPSLAPSGRSNDRNSSKKLYVGLGGYRGCERAAPKFKQAIIVRRRIEIVCIESAISTVLEHELNFSGRVRRNNMKQFIGGEWESPVKEEIPRILGSTLSEPATRENVDSFDSNVRMVGPREQFGGGAVPRILYRGYPQELELAWLTSHRLNSDVDAWETRMDRFYSSTFPKLERVTAVD
ncbi:hypothetical protein FB451DRAFT_1172580 [Mycena latifolia]|nr:hypothetical protein FB451DRAFT_1172580 [Mycena latifolia]